MSRLVLCGNYPGFLRLTRVTSSEFDRTVAGSSFPDSRFKRQILEANSRWRLNKQMALRFYHRYERGQTHDWHFDGLEPLIGNQLLLVTAPEDYATHVFGVFIQYHIE